VHALVPLYCKSAIKQNYNAKMILSISTFPKVNKIAALKQNCKSYVYDLVAPRVTIIE
jgi:hypothetical protein